MDFMISIAMATFNGAKYIREQVDSILSQTIQNFELVISDDCSTDDTWEILQDYASDRRVRVFQNTENMGFKNNFEKAISMCRGEYVALSDQDDIWYSDHLEILFKMMEANRCDVVCGRPVFVDETNKELPKRYDYLKMYNSPKTNFDTARRILLSDSTYQGASMLIRKSFLKIALPIPDGARFHDSWFAVLACFAGGLAYIDKPVSRYRRLSNSVTGDMVHGSAFRKIVGITLNPHLALDRLEYTENIRLRLTLNSSQEKLLNKIETVIKRRSTLIGRLRNLPYLVWHFKAIYATKILHIFS